MDDDIQIHTTSVAPFALLQYKILCTLAIFCTGLVGGILPLRLRVKTELLSYGNTLSGGVFLAAGLTHMLSEAVESFNSLDIDTEIPVPYFLCMLGILITFFLEKVAFTHTHSHHMIQMDEEQQGEEASDSHESRGMHKDPHRTPNNMNMFMLGVVLSFHSIIEGIALGIESSTKGTNNLLLAIIAHKVFDAFAFGVSLAKHSLPTPQIFKLAVAFALTTPLGTVLGLFALQASPSGPLSAVVMALSSGTFVYIALVEVMMEEFDGHQKNKILKFVLLLLGAGIMTYLSHSHGGHGTSQGSHTHGDH